VLGAGEGACAGRGAALWGGRALRARCVRGAQCAACRVVGEDPRVWWRGGVVMLCSAGVVCAAMPDRSGGRRVGSDESRTRGAEWVVDGSVFAGVRGGRWCSVRGASSQAPSQACARARGREVGTRNTMYMYMRDR